MAADGYIIFTINKESGLPVCFFRYTKEEAETCLKTYTADKEIDRAEMIPLDFEEYGFDNPGAIELAKKFDDITRPLNLTIFADTFGILFEIGYDTNLKHAKQQESQS